VFAGRGFRCCKEVQRLTPLGTAYSCCLNHRESHLSRSSIRRRANLLIPLSSAHRYGSSTVQRSILLAAIQKEIHRQNLSYFVDWPPSVAQVSPRTEALGGCNAPKRSASDHINQQDGQQDQKQSGGAFFNYRTIPTDITHETQHIPDVEENPFLPD